MTPVEIATKYIGKTEKPGNAGFNDADFEKKMKDVGFQPGHAWCSYFAELVFKEAYPLKKKEFDKLFSASAVKTFENFKKAGYAIHDTPQLGALVIWQKQVGGKPSWQGHAGIVVEVTTNQTFKSVEGNTNDSGGREGYIVAKKFRRVQSVTNGLQVLGFINLNKN